MRIPAKWRLFGIALKIDSSVLDGFEQQFRGDPMRCFEAIFQWWIKQCEFPRWESLLEILRTGLLGETVLASELSKRIGTAAL